MDMRSRYDLPHYLAGIGVEIGVDHGVYSDKLLAGSNLQLLYSVDPWEPCQMFPTPEDTEAALSATKDRLQKYGSRSSILRMLGQQAATLFLPETLDFVYIDSSHEYLETLEEIVLWWPKLKSNGLLCGHDYCNGPEVKKAVDEFVLIMGLELSVTDWDPESDIVGYKVNSWLIRKP